MYDLSTPVVICCQDSSPFHILLKTVIMVNLIKHADRMFLCCTCDVQDFIRIIAYHSFNNAYMYDVATDSRCEGNLVKMTDLYFNEATLNRLQLLDRYSS